jgi:HEPN domain-containing protein
MSIKLHEKWLSKSKNDLKSSNKLVKGEEPVLDTAIYHTQQCAEKALKAFLAFKEHELIKTHDLVFLVDVCGEYDPEFANLTDDAEKLNPYSTLFRYPDIVLEPEEADVLEAIKMAQALLTFVEQKIAEHLQPTTDENQAPGNE